MKKCVELALISVWRTLLISIPWDPPYPEILGDLLSTRDINPAQDTPITPVYTVYRTPVRMGYITVLAGS